MNFRHHLAFVAASYLPAPYGPAPAVREAAEILGCDPTLAAIRARQAGLMAAGVQAAMARAARLGMAPGRVAGPGPKLPG